MSEGASRRIGESGRLGERAGGNTMTVQTITFRTLERRLRRVERENRVLRRAGAVLVIGVAAVMLMGQTILHRRAVESEAFLVRDAQGQVRAMLKALENGTVGLSFYDQAGVPRAWLRVLTDGTPGLVLSDESGQVRTMLNVQGDGLVGLLFYDQDGRPRAWLNVLADGTGGLALFDEAKESRAWLRGLADGSPGLTFWDEHGNAVRNLP